MATMYTRNTHNFNNETREWEYRKELDAPEIAEACKNFKSIGVHALESGKWSSFFDILHENIESYKSDIMDSYGGKECPTHETIRNELETMIDLGLVKVKE